MTTWTINRRAPLILFIMALAALFVVNPRYHEVEGFHSNWPDWNPDNFVERWYEEQFNPGVQALIFAQGQFINGHLITCTNVLNQIGGSVNCDRTMLNIVSVCNEHMNMFNECRDGRMLNYLSARGLR
jgi:hypothetical protein